MVRIAPTAAAAWPPWSPGTAASPADDDRLGALGDEVNNRLFRAGLDMCSALGLAKDEAVRMRLKRAVAELDDAIKDLRHLMLTVHAERADPRN